MKNLKFTVKLERPHCRTPIKPVQKHKTAKNFSRKVKYSEKVERITLGDY
jgi:hypothetical protein